MMQSEQCGSSVSVAVFGESSLPGVDPRARRHGAHVARATAHHRLSREHSLAPAGTGWAPAWGDCALLLYGR